MSKRSTSGRYPQVIGPLVAERLAPALLRLPDAPALDPRAIVELRQALAISQEAAAELVGVASNTWSRWERGAVEPGPLMRLHLANAIREVREVQWRGLQAGPAGGQREPGWTDAPEVE